MANDPVQGSGTASPALPEAHPSGAGGVSDAMEALFTWNYDPEIEQLRTPVSYTHLTLPTKA